MVARPRLPATRRGLAFFSAVFLFCCSLSSLPAQLVLNVNPSTQEFWFSGTASGTPLSTMSSNYIEWYIVSASGYTGGAPDISTGLDSSASAVIGGTIWQPTVEGGRFGAQFSLSTAATTTITGNSSVFSYAGFTSFAQSALEAGGTAPLVYGTGFGDLTITAVPEPASVALLLGVAALVGVGFLRRRRIKTA